MKKTIRTYSGIGGQAVLEGVMMKNRGKYAVAVRKSDNTVSVEVDEMEEPAYMKTVRKIPFVRGIFVFADSLRLGLKSINMSAAIYDGEIDGEKTTGKDIGGTLVSVAAFVIAMGLFLFLPYFLSELIGRFITSNAVKAILEGLMRIAVFVGYVCLISLMKDVKRLFGYHGAEHKCINCIETGNPLTVENVRAATRLHKRCGTSFMILVMLISIILFFFIRADSVVIRLCLRILLIPVIAGIAYEIIRLAGRKDGLLINILSAPGLWLQRITTREPDDEMIEVGIASVEAVFDWRQYLADAFGKTDLQA